jgi:hypothetical protein
VSGRSWVKVVGSIAAGLVVALILLIAWHEQWIGSGTDFSSVHPDDIVEIQGVPCYGRVDYYDDGTLERCALARDDTLSGQPLAAGTIVHFTKDGIMDWCFLQRDTEIRGHLCRGHGHSWTTAFHPNGQPKLIWLARDEVIQGIPCRAASFWTEVFGAGAGVDFYEDGQLKHCMLSKDFVVGGRQREKGESLTFDRNGKLIRVDRTI